MDGDRFDALTRALGSGRSRRGVLKSLGAATLGAAGLSRLGSADAKRSGFDNTACVTFCNAAFQKGSARYACQHAGAHGSGPCAACGANIANYCQGTCTNVDTDATNCGACGTVCPAVDACTPAQCSGGACNSTSSCTGSQTCGGGGTANVCGACVAHLQPCTSAGQCCSTDHTACAPNNVVIGQNVCCSTLGGACTTGGPSGDCCGVNVTSGQDYAYCSPNGACGGSGAACRFNEACVSNQCCGPFVNTVGACSGPSGCP